MGDSAEDRRRLLRQARDSATTPHDAVAVQSAFVPGRRWRYGLPVTVVAGPALLAVLARMVGATTVASWSAGVAAAGTAWLVWRLVQGRRVVRTSLVAQQLRAPEDVDDRPALDRRAEAVSRWAAERGLPYVAHPAPLTAPNLRNQVAGTIDGLAFTCHDQVSLAQSRSGDEPVRHHLTGAGTSVGVPFPTVLALAVAPDDAFSTLRWSYLGRQVHLESGQFNDTFSVYCDDPLRARLVLNPAVMADLLDWGGPVQLVLADGELRVTALGTFVPPERLDALVMLTAGIERSARAALVT